MRDHGNQQKHLNQNPIQRRLLDNFHNRIIDLVQQTGVNNLLDAGCGEGFVLQCLQNSHASVEAIGGDFSIEALLWGKNNLNHNIPLINFNIHHLPFPDNAFSLVMCLEVLEHLTPTSEAALRELARVSSKYVLLTVPHEPFFRGANFLRGKHISSFGNDPEHLHNYSGRAFRKMVDGVVDIVYHGYAFPWQITLGQKR